MKLVYKDMGHILSFDEGYVNELVIENKKLFFKIVSSIAAQVDGGHGDCVLSIKDRPVELGKYADLTVQFAPFELNRKSLLTKLYSSLEHKALLAENYTQTGNLLSDIERFMLYLSEELPFDVNCHRLTVGSIIKAVSPEIDDTDKSALEKIFSYMELVRELDRDRLFVMVNMRSYFDHSEMEAFTESASLYGFRVLLLESTSQSKLKNTQRYMIDGDLCEF